MPELPEVETIARNLRPVLTGKTIRSADLRWERTLAIPEPAEFIQRVRGQRIETTSRRGKFLILELSSDTLLIHLRMSGDLSTHNGSYQPQKHDHLLLSLSDATTLVFTDPRKFGRVWLISATEQILAGLGPEPFDPAFTASSLYEQLRGRSRQLKPLLLDQTFIAGLGNIYTDEALNLAGLHPLTRSDQITAAQAEKLWNAIRQVLETGIANNGASIDWVYRGGEFQNHFRVYGRAGEPCPACNTPVERIVVGQRGTHLCPTCQPHRS